MGGSQFKVSVLRRFTLRGEKDRDPRNEQRLRQPFDDRIEQRAQVGLGIEAAAEVDERLTVVETLLVEDAVDAPLNTALKRIED